MESVIACSYSLYWGEAVQVIRLCMLRNPWLPESVEVLGCIACQHQFGSVAEKGLRKVGCSSRSDCYSLLLHTLLWTVEENTCLGEEGDRPGELKVYAACRVHFRMSQQSCHHQRVRYVDEMASYYPASNRTRMTHRSRLCRKSRIGRASSSWRQPV
jgi:hypothetical protein